MYHMYPSAENRDRLVALAIAERRWSSILANTSPQALDDSEPALQEG